MATIAQLKKQANAAPKYVITLLLGGVLYYIADKEITLSAGELTTNEAEALKYSVGYDHEPAKLGTWKGWARFHADAEVSKTVAIKYL